MESFYQQFCKELKITEENNLIKLTHYNGAYDCERISDFKIFSEDDKGNVDILVYTIDSKSIEIKHPKADLSVNSIYNNRSSLMSIKRLKEPKTHTDEKTGELVTMKYQFIKGSGTFPFFPPMLVDKFNRKEPIDTLILTEGYKKAWYASLYGVPVVGLSSITHYKEKETQAMYADVIRLIKTCSVKNVIMLYDGDCFNISIKALEEGKDLYTRPVGFYNSCCTVRDLFKDYQIDVWFGCINSDTVEGNPKGLDDIYQAKEGNELELTDDLLSLSRRGHYFQKLNITNATNKLARLFNFDIDAFYRTHSDIIGLKEYVYRGTKYAYDEKRNELKIIIPEAAKNYFRVGDDFFKYVMIPNKYNQLERNYHKRNSGTIAMDHGRNFFQHVPKYEAFCNVPSHTNYSRVIHNCFNLYYEIEHTPEEGDIDISLSLVRHIFGEQYELALDYIQLLYQQPTQILPILCLVSKENKTGKSTFIKWLKAIFGQNATVIGNDQLNNNFNGSWGSKLLIACEESFVEKISTVEKIKALSTGDKIQMELKGRDAVEIDFFGKFILASNKEENFIYANKDDIRYWVVKVPVIPPGSENVRLMYQLIDEIPAFLHFLNNRKMSTENETRMWFRESLLQTEALKKLREANKPKMERILVDKIKELFLDSGEAILHLPINYIQTYILKSNKDEEIYIRKILEDHIGVKRYTNKNGQYASTRVQVPYYDADGDIAMRSERCRPYIFNRDEFLTPEDYAHYEVTKKTVEHVEEDPEDPFQMESIPFPI